MVFPVFFWLTTLACACYALAVVCDRHCMKALDILARRLRISDDASCAILLAIGTSIPCIFLVFIVQATAPNSGMGSGTVIGAGIVHLLLATGCTLTMSTSYKHWSGIVHDMTWYLAAVVLLIVISADHRVHWWEATLLPAVFAAYLWSALRLDTRNAHHRTVQSLRTIPHDFIRVIGCKRRKEAHWAILPRCIDRGIGSLFCNLTRHPSQYGKTLVTTIPCIGVLSVIIVRIGMELAQVLRIAPVVVGVTILATGISATQIVASRILARNGRGDMAVRSAIASNIFQLFFCLGIPWCVSSFLRSGPVLIGTELIAAMVMLFFCTVIVSGFLLALHIGNIGHHAGWALVGLYVLYICCALYYGMHPVVLQPDRSIPRHTDTTTLYSPRCTSPFLSRTTHWNAPCATAYIPRISQNALHAAAGTEAKKSTKPVTA